MLNRTLEPEYMDSDEDAESYDAMDFREPNERFGRDALALLGTRDAPRGLDIGTGTAQIPAFMLREHPRLTMLCVDMADSMLRVAARRIEREGLRARCELTRMDAKSLAVPETGFDLVVCNSVVHHIPEPLDLFREIARVVRPDGALLVRDLIRPTSEARAWEIVDRAAAGESESQRKLFFDSLCAALTLDEVEQLVIASGLVGVRVWQVSDRHWSAERAAR